MQYLLTIYADERFWTDASPEDVGKTMAAYGALGEEMKAAGVILGGEGLESSSTATTVKVRDGETITSDGPFAETREVLGGYYLIETDSLEEATEWAARIPSARYGTVEVRPVVMRHAEVSA
jgi:hypothetical protein